MVTGRALTTRSSAANAWRSWIFASGYSCHACALPLKTRACKLQYSSLIPPPSCGIPSTVLHRREIPARGVAARSMPRVYPYHTRSRAARQMAPPISRGSVLQAGPGAATPSESVEHLGRCAGLGGGAGAGGESVALRQAWLCIRASPHPLCPLPGRNRTIMHSFALLLHLTAKAGDVCMESPPCTRLPSKPLLSAPAAFETVQVLVLRSSCSRSSFLPYPSKDTVEMLVQPDHSPRRTFFQ